MVANPLEGGDGAGILRFPFHLISFLFAIQPRKVVIFKKTFLNREPTAAA